MPQMECYYWSRVSNEVDQNLYWKSMKILWVEMN